MKFVNCLKTLRSNILQTKHILTIRGKSVLTNFHANVWPSPFYHCSIFVSISETLSFNEPHTATSSNSSSSITKGDGAAALATTTTTTMSSSIMTTTDSEQPYFDFELQRNVTVTVGQTGFLHCRVERLGDKDVSKWFMQLFIFIFVGLLCELFLGFTQFKQIVPSLRLNESEQCALHSHVDQKPSVILLDHSAKTG